MVCITMEKSPLELWDRRSVASSISDFPNLVNIDHACLRGHDFAALFFMAKVESLDHIPHHLAFHKSDEMDAYADVYINEIWDIDNPSFIPPPLPRPHHPSPPFCHRNSQPPTSPNSRSHLVRANSQSPVPSSHNSRIVNEATTTIFRTGGRARRILQQNVNPNLFDLLAFLAQTKKVEITSFPGHTLHASFTFE